MKINPKKGIKPFVEISIAAIFKEYKQLDDGHIPGKPLVEPFNPDGLTPLDKNKTQEAVNLIKQKRCGNIKVTTCANGSKQIKYLKPDESVYSPICSTEALMEILVIYAMDQRDVSIFDVPGAFLKTAIPADKFLLIQIRDEFVDVIYEVNPE